MCVVRRTFATGGWSGRTSGGMRMEPELSRTSSTKRLPRYPSRRCRRARSSGGSRRTLPPSDHGAEGRSGHSKTARTRMTCSGPLTPLLLRACFARPSNGVRLMSHLGPHHDSSPARPSAALANSLQRGSLADSVVQYSKAFLPNSSWKTDSLLLHRRRARFGHVCVSHRRWPCHTGATVSASPARSIARLPCRFGHDERWQP
jgi:hypothetical protein